jgi:hypothetical protein
VVIAYEYHCVAIPIFSFNENGVKLKTNKDEFVGIQDNSISSDIPSESKHPRLTFKRAKEFRHLTQGFHVMSAAPYAHVTFPVSFRYSLPCIFEGRLLKASLRSLLDLYRTWSVEAPFTEKPGRLRLKSKVKT